MIPKEDSVNIQCDDLIFFEEEDKEE